MILSKFQDLYGPLYKVNTIGCAKEGNECVD